MPLDGGARLAEGCEPATPMKKSPGTLLGPFTARHLGLIGAAVAASTVVLFLATRSIASTGVPRSVNPVPTFYQISPEGQGLNVGQLAPELVGVDGGKEVRLSDLGGRPISLAALRGHPVWINFWATWCPPCQVETPSLQDAYEAHKADGLVLVAIDVQEDAATVRDYATRYRLTYPIGLDVTGAVFHVYRVWGIPTHYFIDRHGVIRGRYFGPLTRAEIEQQLSVILGP